MARIFLLAKINGQTCRHKRISRHRKGSDHTVTFGEKRKYVTFNLDHPEERELYELASSIKFAPLVKRFLVDELRRKRPLRESAQSSIQVHME